VTRSISPSRVGIWGVGFRVQVSGHARLSIKSLNACDSRVRASGHRFGRFGTGSGSAAAAGRMALK